MCEKQGIVGKNITPFVLSEVSRLTKGLSMDTSKKYIKYAVWLISSYILFIHKYFVFRHFFIEEQFFGWK